MPTNIYSDPVTVIVAAYNSQRSMTRCIEHILDLDYPHFSVIIVDNNSTDRTAELIKKFPQITYLFERKKGWPAARNTAIREAKTHLVANIDADCFATRDWLKQLTRSLDDDRIWCVVGKTLVEEGRTLAQRYYADSDPLGFEHKLGKTELIPWGGGNNIMRRDIFLQAGGYDAVQFTSGADIELHRRIETTMGYRTRYEPSALIHHEARGSVAEFFQVAAKYAHDGYQRSLLPEMRETRGYFRFYALRNLWQIALRLAGIVVRASKALVGRDTWFRVAANGFAIISLTGTIYGYAKCRTERLSGKLNHAPRKT